MSDDVKRLRIALKRYDELTAASHQMIDTHIATGHSLKTRPPGSEPMYAEGQRLYEELATVENVRMLLALIDDLQEFQYAIEQTLYDNPTPEQRHNIFQRVVALRAMEAQIGQG